MTVFVSSPRLAHTHTHTHTHSLTHTLSLSVCLSLSPIQSHSHSLTHYLLLKLHHMILQDPNKLKRPLSAWNFFLKEKLLEVSTAKAAEREELVAMDSVVPEGLTDEGRQSPKDGVSGAEVCLIDNINQVVLVILA